MSDESRQHDEAALPEDAVEDLAPEGAEQEVSGGAVDAFAKFSPSPVSDKDGGIQVDSFSWGSSAG
jgi:hypothetical protein